MILAQSSWLWDQEELDRHENDTCEKIHQFDDFELKKVQKHFFLWPKIQKIGRSKFPNTYKFETVELFPLLEWSEYMCILDDWKRTKTIVQNLTANLFLIYTSYYGIVLSSQICCLSHFFFCIWAIPVINLPSIGINWQQFVSVHGPVFWFAYKTTQMGKDNFSWLDDHWLLGVFFKQDPFALVLNGEYALRLLRWNKFCKETKSHSLAMQKHCKEKGIRIFLMGHFHQKLWIFLPRLCLSDWQRDTSATSNNRQIRTRKPMTCSTVPKLIQSVPVSRRKCLEKQEAVLGFPHRFADKIPG